MHRPTFTATALMNARRDPDAESMELNLLDAKGHTQNVILDKTAVAQVMAAMLQKSTGKDAPPAIYQNECIPLFRAEGFRIDPGYAGLRMFIGPADVIDFLFDKQHAASLKAAIDHLAANVDQPAA